MKKEFKFSFMGTEFKGEYHFLNIKKTLNVHFENKPPIEGIGKLISFLKEDDFIGYKYILSDNSQINPITCTENKEDFMKLLLAEIYLCEKGVK